MSQSLESASKTGLPTRDCNRFSERGRGDQERPTWAPACRGGSPVATPSCQAPHPLQPQDPATPGLCARDGPQTGCPQGRWDTLQRGSAQAVTQKTSRGGRATRTPLPSARGAHLPGHPPPTTSPKREAGERKWRAPPHVHETRPNRTGAPGSPGTPACPVSPTLSMTPRGLADHCSRAAHLNTSASWLRGCLGPEPRIQRPGFDSGSVS